MSDLEPMCSAWATSADASSCAGDAWPCGDDATLIDGHLASASYILYQLSRRKYPGICTKMEQPPSTCQCSCLVPSATGFFYGYYAGTAPTSQPWPWQGDSHCDCLGRGTIALSAYPVREIIAIEIDGVMLDPTDGVDARLIANRYLLRMADADGHRQHWPTRNRLDLPLGSVGTWAVTYDYGRMPPQAGVDAAVEYAKELAKACACDDSCRLPENVQSYARQGVIASFFQATTFLQNGLPGTPLADAFLLAERYADRMGAPAAFYNPDEFCAPVTVPSVGS